MAESFEQLRSEFFAETEDTLQNLQQDLNEFGQSADSGQVPEEVLDRVFRTTHSLKGVAGLFGLTRMSAVSHSMESVLDSIRRADVAVDGGLADLLHRGNEVLHALLAAGAAGDEATEDGAATTIVADLEAALAERKPELSDEEQGLQHALHALDPDEREAVQRAVKLGRTIAVVEATLPREGFETPFRELLDEIRGWGTVHGSASFPPEAANDAFRVQVVTSGSDELFPLMKSVGPLGGNVLLGDPGRLFEDDNPAETGQDSAREAEPLAADPPPAPAPRRSEASLRVPVKRADRLLTQLGDLIQSKMGLDETANEVLEARGRVSPTQLLQSLRGLDRHIRALQGGILSVRLVALAPLFQKLERAFRKSCRATGKEASLVTEGERLELDKGVVEAITEAMVHLVRNAVDHGLESPDQRAATGKPRVGTVRITASTEGSHTVLDVFDDGGGVDFERVRQRARERGIVAANAEPSRAELLDLLLRPGFTLKDSVTEISGRGVGLDAVRDAIARIGGTIEILDQDVGTTFRLRVPISLAVVRALEIVVSGRSYFMPLSHVGSALRVAPGEIERGTDDEPVYVGGGERIPVRTLSSLLEASGISPAGEIRSAIQLSVGERRLVVPVDRVGRQREIVVRSLGSLLSGVSGVSGCTELGDGRTVLILDPMALLEMAGPGATGVGA